MSGSLLPAGFATLEPYVGQWAIAGSAARAARRASATPDQRQAFFTAATPLLGAALDRLDQSGLHQFDPAEQRLMDLMLTLAHVAQAVETQGPDEEAGAIWRERMQITRSPADHP